MAETVAAGANQADEVDPETASLREPASAIGRALVTWTCVAFAGLYLYFAGFAYFSPESFVALYLGFTLVLVFALVPGRKGRGRRGIGIVDLVLMAAATAITIHYSLSFQDRFVDRWGIPNDTDIAFGVVAIVVALEACRRTLGLVLPGLCAVLIAYAYLGPYVPGLARHNGLSTSEIVSWLYSNEGIYGPVTRVFATFVFLFVVFGACLEMSGGRALFLNLPLALLGRVTGGPAKVCALASALFGMISGSAAANVVTTGSLTIPLMKRAGFQPHVAAAFEATASTIGITMPPIMGAAVFIMADITGIPYFEIVKVSFIPAFLFIFSLLAVADLYARKMGLRPLSAEEIGHPWTIVRRSWVFLIPVGILVYMLVGGYSPNYAVFWSLPAIFVASLFSRETRLPLSRWVEIIATGTKRSLSVGAMAGCLGIIVGLVVKTGIATKLSYIVIDLSHGSLLVAVLLTALVTFLLGTGVSSVTADYILLSTLVAPALIQLGGSTMASHLLIIWYTQTSNLTPPVCAVAFAAAALAGAAPWRTGFFAFRIGLFIYLIPIGFVMGNLLRIDDPWLLALATVTTAISAICFAAVVVGWFIGPLTTVPRILMAGAMIGFYAPDIPTDIVGVVLMAGVTAWQLAQRRRAVALVPIPAVVARGGVGPDEVGGNPP